MNKREIVAADIKSQGDQTCFGEDICIGRWAQRFCSLSTITDNTAVIWLFLLVSFPETIKQTGREFRSQETAVMVETFERLL